VRGVSVTATATMDYIEYDMGDGAVIRCREGTAFEMRLAGQPSPTCGHVYEHTSGKQPGGVYTIVATTYWTVSWTSNTGSSGTIPMQLTNTAHLPMGELQTIITE
jgi:hypothetical protein